MGCGCRKNKSNDSRSSSGDLTLGKYQVWKSGSYTGRSFSSQLSAQNYAARIGGEVRASE